MKAATRPGVVRNERLSTSRQRKQQHLLDVKVRSRKAAQQRTHRFINAICKIFLVGAAIGGTAYGAREGLRRFLWENPDYRLSDIEIADDGNSVSRDQLLKVAGIHEGMNIFLINLTQAREKLAEIPQIEHVEIEREVPGKIAITLSERKPVAWLAGKSDEDPSASDSSCLVDKKGVLIKPKSHLAEYLHLPIIYRAPGADNFQAGQTVNAFEIRSALDLIRLNTESAVQTRFQIRSIDLSKGYCMVVTDQDRALVTFGFDRLDWQLDRLGILLDQIDESKKELQTVNLMVERNVPVTFVEPVAEDVDAAAEPTPAATPTPVRKALPAGKEKKPAKKSRVRKHSERDEQG